MKPGNISVDSRLQFLAALFSALALLFIHLSPALASIFTGLLMVIGLVIVFKGQFPSLLKNVGIFFLLLAVWYGITALINPPLPEHLNKLQLKIPLLCIAFVFPAFCFSNKVFSYWLMGLCIPLTCMVLASLINYFRHYEFFNIMVLESKPVPIFSRLYHIEFSIAVAVMLLLILHFILNRAFKKSLFKPFLLVCFIIGIAGLHVFAVRTALLLFYTGLLVLCIGNYRFWLRKWFLLLGALLVAVTVLLSVPSLRNRAINTLDDAGTIVNKGELNNKSGGLRVVAWKIALQTAKGRLHRGYGPGGATRAMFDTYSHTQTGIMPSNWKMPHNQWLEFLIQSGWVAVFLFTMGLVALFYYTDLLGKALTAGFTVACVFESLLERQDGFLIFLVVVLLSAARGLEKNSKKN